MILKAARGAEIHEKIEKYFPGLVEDDANVHLLILCLRYIDLANTLHEPPNCFTNSTTGRAKKPKKKTKMFCKEICIFSVTLKFFLPPNF